MERLDFAPQLESKAASCSHPLFHSPSIYLLSVWYLSRRSFREFAVQFVTEYDKEKHSRMMQKVSQKKILDDIRS